MLVRSLIVLLLVLNVGVAGWWIARDPAPAPAPVEPPPGVARLQLVGEADPTPPPAAPAESVPPADEAPSTSGAAADVVAPALAQSCFSFGPFATQAAADAAATKLRSLVQKVSVREQNAAARGWRVFLPPQSSPADAQAMADRITAAGFSDLLIVREGADANSIALGRYRNEEGAKTRAQALNAAGFAVKLEPLEAEAPAAVWLDTTADEAFDPKRAQSLIAATQHRKRDCAPPR